MKANIKNNDKSIELLVVWRFDWLRKARTKCTMVSCSLSCGRFRSSLVSWAPRASETQGPAYCTAFGTCPRAFSTPCRSCFRISSTRPTRPLCQSTFPPTACWWCRPFRLDACRSRRPVRHCRISSHCNRILSPGNFWLYLFRIPFVNLKNIVIYLFLRYITLIMTLFKISS